jgi:hypothetical protein
MKYCNAECVSQKHTTCNAPSKFPATPVDSTSCVEARDTMLENTVAN